MYCITGLLTEVGTESDWLEDLELASKAHEIILEAMETAKKSASKLRKMQQGADGLQSG
jgi:enolase